MEFAFIAVFFVCLAILLICSNGYSDPISHISFDKLSLFSNTPKQSINETTIAIALGGTMFCPIGMFFFGFFGCKDNQMGAIVFILDIAFIVASIMLVCLTQSALIITIYFVLLALVLFFAIRVGRYTYLNFYEVVSRRMMYRNSCVSLFEESLKYSLNRFTACLNGLILIFICILLTYVVYPR